MASVVNNPPEAQVVHTGGSDAVSWMMAVAIIIILAVGAFYLLPRIAGRETPAPQSPGANINVTLPANSGSGAGTGSINSGGTGAPQTP